MLLPQIATSPFEYPFCIQTCSLYYDIMSIAFSHPNAGWGSFMGVPTNLASNSAMNSAMPTSHPASHRLPRGKFISSLSPLFVPHSLCLCLCLCLSFCPLGGYNRLPEVSVGLFGITDAVSIPVSFYQSLSLSLPSMAVPPLSPTGTVF